MPGSSNTSFIPKRNPAMGDRRGNRRQVYIGTFVVQILFIASLLATAGVFIYEYRLNKTLDTEIVALNTAIGTFNEAEMQRVQAADLRLSQANDRLAYSASVISLLESIEVAVVDSVQISELEVERVSDEAFEVQAQIRTDSFNSVLFQRAILDDSRTLAFSEIKDLVLQNVPPSGTAFTEQLDAQVIEEFSIGFKVLLAVDQANIPHQIAPVTDQATPVAASSTEVSDTSSVTETVEGGEESSNQEQI